MTEVTDPQISRRKADHIRINLEENVQFPRVSTGLEKLYFIHQAVPEINLSEVDLSLELFGRKLDAPLLISSMIGGTEEAQQLNLRMAEAAQVHRMAMGLGSQRAAIEHSDLIPTFQVRSVAPDILLFANLGVVQFNYGYGPDECRRAIDMVEADALILHFNVLQEAVQPEGDTNWSSLLNRIEEVTRVLEVPVIAKEVGWGFSETAARKLKNVGISAIDVAGAGGTSWSEVEYHRAPTAFHARVARAFADWGIPTADTIRMVAGGAPDLPIFASGGLKDGIDVAKCIALGATLGGMAGVYLRAANSSYEALDETIQVIKAQLRIAMQCVGASTLAELRETSLFSEGKAING
ncbi:MAG: type 2 isopentenyl-diphosphate Delta-isomerase [Chloroflexi bacterium]|nr:type 2 isopentenyl-diphosphate Delta-isomerase [Chloroflexota bacterium]